MSISNYQFAKFCWKALVQPQLQTANGDEKSLTNWLLDDDPSGKITAGVIERLLRHVDIMSKDTEAAQQKGKKSGDTHFDISLSFTVNSAVLSFGSSMTFTNPLFEVRLQASAYASALLSAQTWWFVPERDNEEKDTISEYSKGEEESDGERSNEVRFQSLFSVHYLNTKHDHMECLIEQYPSFGHFTYKTFMNEALIYYGDDPESKSTYDDVHDYL